MAWVVPQLMEAWDDEGVDVDRTMDRIINGVMHHPAQREMGDDGARDCREIMMRSVEEWWSELGSQGQDEYRQKLSREGVLNGQNHREGVHDTGHGCGKPLGMHKNYAGSGGGSIEDQIASNAANAIIGGLTGGVSDMVASQTGIHLPSSGGGGRQDNSGGGSEGGLGGLLSNIGGSLLSGFGDGEKQSYSSGRQDGNSYTESRTEYGQSGGRSEEINYSRTEYTGGGEAQSYMQSGRNEDSRGNTTSYSYEERTESRPSQYGGGYEERREERREERYENRQESSWGGGREESYGGGGRRDDDYGRREDNYGGGRRDDNYGGGRRDDDEYGRRDEGGYGRPPPPRDDFGGGGFGGPPPPRDDYGGGRDDYERRDDHGRRRDDEERRW